MTFDPSIHGRRSIRLRGYDYSLPGAYFVTLCVSGRLCLFGDVFDDEVRLTTAGEIARIRWSELPGRFGHIALSDFIVMPNHIHGILINELDTYDRAPDSSTVRTVVGARFIAPNSEAIAANSPSTAHSARAPTLGNIVRAFKATTAREIREHVDPAFAWQRNYYERVIRDDDEMKRIRKYIIENPIRWNIDRDNPDATTDGDEPML
ncbi:MAG: transposase [Deltaproteobacteria bacterium]|nr:transposase [Deltaproteobacteria bacterium]